MFLSGISASLDHHVLTCVCVCVLCVCVMCVCCVCVLCVCVLCVVCVLDIYGKQSYNLPALCMHSFLVF